MKTLKKIIVSSHSFKRLALLFSMALILTAAVGTSLAFIVTRTPSLYNIFVNGLNTTGNLVIQKTVEHPFGDSYMVPDNIEFAFEVDLGAENAGKIFADKAADEKGVIHVTVKADSAVTIGGIEAGTKVTVTELPAGGGFSVKDGSSVREVTIEKNQNNKVEFVNIYTPQKAPADGLTVTGVKKLTGREWQEGDSFTFRLELFENGTWTGLGTDTVAYHLTEREDAEHPGKTVWAPEPDFDKFEFSKLLQGISFDKAGTYSFRVTEVEGTVGGVAYDKAESCFDILVGDADMDGELEIQKITTASSNTQITEDGENGSHMVSILFSNRYAPAGSAEAVIHIRKILNDTSGQNKAPAGFTFGLYDESGTLLKTSEATSAAGETDIRLIFGPEEAGQTFAYILREINGGQTLDGIIYDSREIKIQVSVVDNLDGTVSAFVYDYQESAESGETVSSGETASSGEEDVSAEEETVEAGEESPDSSSQEEAQSEGENSESDETKTSQGADTEASQSGEMKALQGGTAEDAESGEEVLTSEPETVISEETAPRIKTRIPEGASGVYNAEFQNTYKPKAAEAVVSGGKDLAGRDMKAGEFSFNLYETGSDFAVAEGAQPVASASNSNEEGAFCFESLTFNKAGTYYYVVTEDSSAQLVGISYDDARYFVTIQVADAGGALFADTSIRNENGEESEIKFFNTYAAEKAALILTGEKTLVGRNLEENEFSFDLYEATDAFEPVGTAIQSVKNDSRGTFQFKELSFAEEGIWHYVVKEDAEAPVKGVIYDRTEYHVTVKVTDNGAGVLVPVVDIGAFRGQEETAVDAIRFENIYTSSPDDVSVPVVVKKIVNNVGSETIGPEGFSFVLTNTETGEKSVVKSDEDGLAGFTLTFTKDDAGKTYHYHLEEETGTMKGITYSDAAYDFEAVISLDASGKPFATITSGGETVEQLTAEFVNIYNSGNGEPSVDSQSGSQSGLNTGDDSQVLLYVMLLMTGIALFFLIPVIDGLGGHKKE